LESISGVLGGQAAVARAGIEERAEFGIVLQQLLDQVVVVLWDGSDLKRREPIDSDNDRFLLAQFPILAQVCLCFTQRDDLHGVQ
jgi:hypothetical protein